MSIDLIIVAVFLIINLSVGLYYGRGIKTIREYAVGDRNFTTATIAATIVATWVGGNFFTVHVSESYKAGFWYAIAGAGEAFSLLIVGNIFGPRMREFLGSLSVAETMGNLYNKPIRIVTALCSIAQAIGITASQIKVFSIMFSYFLGFSSFYATLIGSGIVITYSTFGGIKAVTFTDMIQFLTFGVFIPMFALFIWQVIGNTDTIASTLTQNPLFDYHELTNFSNPKFLPYFFIFLWCLIPSFNSTMFQRTLMAKDTNQIRRSFTIAAIICLVIHLFCCFIGLVILSHNPNLDPNKVAMYVIDNYTFQGLRGLTLIGIMAMVMSTADSWINTASVIFSHDFCKPLGMNFKNELFVTRIFVVIIGVCAVLLSLSSDNLLQLGLLTSNFYRPIVTVPLVFAILGFRSSSKAVGIGMLTGVIMVITWRTQIQPSTGIDSVIPGMLANLVAFMLAHYAYAQPGGWIKKTQRIEEENE